MRISDWSSDVCSSDLAYTGFATDTTTQQMEGQLRVDPPQRFPQRGCEPRLGVPASRGQDRNRTWRGAATPRRDSMTVLDRKWPQTATRHKRFSFVLRRFSGIMAGYLGDNVDSMGEPEKKRPSSKRSAGRKPSVADDSERSPAEKPVSLADRKSAV